MAENQPQPPAQPSEAADEKRLESWKEVAAYLQRDVRTVKRWEKKEGLPVHRHLHQRQATVYAYEAELEAWRNSRRPAGGEEEPRPSVPWRRWRIGIAAVAVAAAAGIGLWLWLSRTPVLPFEERDWVLISHFQNRTGEPVFEGAVEYALERELSASRFVNVVPRERIQDALRLMRKPPDTPVDAQVGREVCLRDGGIRALLTGRVEKLDTTYVLSVSLLNPQTGATVASFSQEAVGQRAVVAAVQRLAEQVREALGEGLASIGRNQDKLAKVTTPSLRALQLFTQADALIAGGNNLAAEDLLRQAIVEDSEFASAYNHLAHAIHNQGRPREEWLSYAEKAVALADRATERERFFILGSYYGLTGQDEKAVSTYDALLRFHPDDFWANNNMSYRLLRLGRYREAARYRGRNARLRPNSLGLNLSAAGELSRWPSRPWEAQPFVQRALQLASPGSSEARAPEVRSPEEDERLARSLAWLELYPARESWMVGDLEGALRQANEKARRLAGRQGRERELLAGQLRQFYFTLGKFSAAEALLPDPEDGAFIALAGNDTQALRFSLRGILAPGGAEIGPVEVILAARLGMLPEAEKALGIAEKNDFSIFWASWSATEVNEAARKIMRGELARSRGRTAEALSLLQAGFNQLPPLGLNTYFLAAESLAELYQQQGNPEKAVEVLRKAGGERRRALYYSGSATLLWMRDQLLLARLYRRLGRAGEAEELEAQLRKLLAHADAGHPILLQLEQEQTAQPQ